MENTKQKILNSALTLFAKSGYEAVSVKDIADSLCITKGALYRHYKSKRDIFDSIVLQMAENDAKRAAMYLMPQTSVQQNKAAYRQTQIESVVEYTKAQFDYWTTDKFAANFRRLLTLEQFKSKEGAALYQQYLCGGPLCYIADIFSAIIPEKDSAAALALEFYSPMFMLYSLFDGGYKKQDVNNMLCSHIDLFLKNCCDK